jgi:hypothetical protein
METAHTVLRHPPTEVKKSPFGIIWMRRVGQETQEKTIAHARNKDFPHSA